MADGTVRGTFDLNTGPAVRGVRTYRREAASADAQTRQLGNTMDRTFGPKRVAEIEATGAAMRGVGRDSIRMRTEVAQSWQGMRRDIQRESTAVIGSLDLMERKMNDISRQRMSPTVDIDGIARAIAQIDILEAKLARLDAMRSTPSVSLIGGIGSGGGGGGGGGARAFASSGGGVGIGGKLGRFALIGGAIGLPAIQAAGGAGVGIGGSLGAAALGAGPVGIGGAGPLAAGAAGFISVAKPALTAMKEVQKQQEAMTEAIREYGRGSKEATAAQEAYNRARTQAGPGSGYATGQLRGLSRDWRRESAPARQQFYGLIGDSAQQFRGAAPAFARDAQTSTKAVRGAGGDFTSFLTGKASMDNMHFFSQTFARELPTAEKTLEHVVLGMERLSRSAVPFFHEANDWAENWTAGWAGSTRDIEGTRRSMDPLVDSAKKWADLTGSTFTLLKDIFSAGRPSGDSMVADLTKTFDRWDAWVQGHPGEVQDFFERTARSTEKMASALASVVKFLNQMGTALSPLLDRFSELVKVLSSLGLIGTPGALAGIMGGYRAMKGGGGGGGMGSMLGMGMMMRGGGRGGGAAGAAGSRYGLGAAYTTFGMQRGLAAREGLGGIRATASAARTAGGGLMGAEGALGLGLRGAGKAAWPIMAGMAALDFASFDGDIGGRAQNAVSGASFGLIKKPKTAAEISDDAARGLGKFTTTGSIDAEVARLRGQLKGDGSSHFISGGRAGGRMVQDEGIQGAARKAAEQRIKLLNDERKAVEATNRVVAKQRSIRRAGEFTSGLDSAFNVYRKAGQTTDQAAANTTQDIKHRMRGTREGGMETLGEGSLSWAKSIGGTAGKKAVDQISDAIEARYRRLGKRISIINGDILTGSKTEWGSIRDAMAQPAERAAERISTAFTEIQRKAAAELTLMGFSKGQANSLVRGLEKGGAAGSIARKDAASGPNPQQAEVADAKRARGGMIGGSGLADTVPVPGGLAAPGEAWIANRHTLAQMSLATRSMYGLTAEQMISGETRPHWMGQKHARGGATRSLNGGQLAGVNSGVAQIATAAMSHFPGLGVTSTTGGGHAKNSLHYQGAAVDLAGGDMNAAAAWIGKHYNLSEGIHNPNLSVKNGEKVPPSFWGAETWGAHANHIHVGLLGKVEGAKGDVVGSSKSGGNRSVNVKAPNLGVGGVGGAMAQRAADAYAAGLTNKLNKKIGGGGGGGGDLSGFSGGGGASANKALGHKMMLAAGWGEDQWDALNTLWQGESGWNEKIKNKSSGAFGIPQALPASKMGKAAVGGDAAAQIRWGLDYIKDRYKSPSKALSAWNSRSPHWYARGGNLKFAGAFDKGGSFVTDGPTAFIAGEGPRNRRERVTVGPASGAGGHGGPQVHVGGITVKVSGHGGDAEQLAEKIGEKVTKKLTAALKSAQSKGKAG